MDRGRVGEDRGSKEMDGCPLTLAYPPSFLQLSRMLKNSRSYYFPPMTQKLSKNLNDML
jgi:hypothetical protein